jgi:ATP-dependent Clp protease ATP-binding subunit ClpX
VYICGECIDLCQVIIHQEKRRRDRSARTHAPAADPEALRARLDQLVAGQDEAKEALVLTAGCWHEGAARVLLIGPSPASRAFLARALAHVLEAPFAAGNPAGLVKARRGDVEAIPLLYDLLLASDFDVEAAQRGVVYLDGVDRLEAREASLRLWKAPVEVMAGHEIDPRRILFVCGGTFPGLEEAIARSGRHPEQPVTGEALVGLGARPEWVSHLRAIARAGPLGEETLARIVAWVDFSRMNSEQAS